MFQKVDSGSRPLNHSQFLNSLLLFCGNISKNFKTYVFIVLKSENSKISLQGNIFK